MCVRARVRARARACACARACVCARACACACARAESSCMFVIDSNMTAWFQLELPVLMAMTNNYGWVYYYYVQIETV